LKLLVKDCGYADPDEMVRDRVAIGCHATKTREKLIQEGSDLTIEKAIDIARIDEMSKAQLKTMTTENPSINSVNRNKQKKPYWQLKLDEQSSKVCTFNTPFGKYRFTRLPFGIKSAPEVFQICMSELFVDVDGVKVIVDDFLIWRKDDDEHDARLKQVLDRAREVNLKFNAKKCRIRQEEVPYVGHVLSKDGLKPDPEKIKAVKEMKPPQNTKELKTFLGFIQYLGKFMPNMATVSAPLRELLEKKIARHWNQE